MRGLALGLTWSAAVAASAWLWALQRSERLLLEDKLAAAARAEFSATPKLEPEEAFGPGRGAASSRSVPATIDDWSRGEVAARQRQPRAASGAADSRWSFAGRKTARDALETVIWAAMAGDVEQLAEAITFSDDARIQAEELFGHLPAEARAEHRDPKHLFALLLAARMPLSYTDAVVEQEAATDRARALRTRLTRPHGEERVIHLVFTEASDGWRLVVPAHVVEKYALGLKVEAADLAERAASRP